MASRALIDIEALLQPLSEDMPAGLDCREDPSPLSSYQTLKGARNAARADERNNLFSDANQEADEHWRKVIDLAPKILSTETKDLEVLCWLSEAMVRRYGFAGLRDTFKVLLGFTENFWDQLYPMPDEDGIETRVAPLAGLNGEGSEGVLIAPIRNTLITEGNTVGPFTFWQYQQALEALRKVDEKARERKYKELGYDVEDIEKAVSETSSQFMFDLRDDLQECLTLFREIGRKLDEVCGIYDSPPTSNIINVLEECLGAVLHLGESKFAAEQAAADQHEKLADSSVGEPPGGTETDATQPIHVVSGPIKSREQAFKQLLEIADFFRQTEPHSPVSYVLQKAVKWGNMPLFELMQELISDNNVLAEYSKLTGVQTEDENSP